MGFREKCYFATMPQQPRRHLMQIGLDAADQAMRTVGYRYSQRNYLNAQREQVGVVAIVHAGSIL